MIDVLVLLFTIMFFVGADLYANGIEYDDSVVKFNGKALMIYSFLGMAACVVANIMNT